MYRCLNNRIGLFGCVVVAALLVATAGCSTAKTTANDGDDAFESQNWDAAVYHYLQALAEEPDSVEYKMQLAFARQKASQTHFQNGISLRRLGRLLAARNELQMAIQLDPTNQYAAQILDDVIEEMEILSLPNGARKLEDLKAQARQAKVQPPVLDPKSNEPITLNFPKPKPVKEIYNAIGKAYGFNNQEFRTRLELRQHLSDLPILAIDRKPDAKTNETGFPVLTGRVRVSIGAEPRVGGGGSYRSHDSRQTLIEAAKDI